MEGQESHRPAYGADGFQKRCQSCLCNHYIWKLGVRNEEWWWLCCYGLNNIGIQIAGAAPLPPASPPMGAIHKG